MIILTRKKQDKILQRLCETERIFASLIKQCPKTAENIEAIECLADNITDISYGVGGLEGMKKVYDSLQKGYESNETK